MKSRLIVFTRYPEAGKTKTRLIPALGPEGAADLQRSLTEHTINTARTLRNNSDIDISVYYTGRGKTDFEDWLGQDLELTDQGGGDLGARINRAFRLSFESGTDRSVIIGIDCPDVTGDIIAEAFDALSTNDIVLGPAEDGGFYLLGTARPCPELLSDIEWGTESVLSSALKNAERLSLDTHLAQTLSDIDTPHDLPVWQKYAKKAMTSKISIIIPALNEAENLGVCIQKAILDSNAEVIVVDGGSSDDTRTIAKRSGAEVIKSEKGRAVQMNQGAAAATGDILMFLHADTHLPPDYGSTVRCIIKSDSIAAGAFQLRIEPSSPGTRSIERLVRLRSSLMRMPYGDQALFMRTNTFRKIKGYRDMPIMEDFNIIRRLKRTGRIEVSSESVVTSSRRWDKLGPFRTTMINQIVIAGYYLGVSPEKLAALYRRKTP